MLLYCQDIDNQTKKEDLTILFLVFYVLDPLLGAFLYDLNLENQV